MPAGTNPMVTRLYGHLMTEANGYTVGAPFSINGTAYAIRTATADGGDSLQITKTSGALPTATLPFEQYHRPNYRCFDRLENWR